VSEGITVLIDGTAIPRELGGVGRYLEGLVQGLTELRYPFALVLRRGHVDHFRALAPQASIVVAPALIDNRVARFAWEQVGLPALRRRLGARVLHSPHYTFPLTGGGRHVVTVHDATFFSLPEAHGRLKRAFFSAWIRIGMRRRIDCVVPSDATGREVRRYVRRGRARVHVAHHGVDRLRFHPPTEAERAEAREAAGLAAGARWIAFLGTIEPRKNVRNLILAHRELRARAGAATPELVIAGARGWDAAAAAELDRSGPADGVHEAGYLPLEVLSGFLGGAEAVVYPSDAEGFGLPVLEAMAAGACVITAPKLAIPEVGGDAVHYSETDAASLRQAIETVLGDDALRHRLRSAALERAAGFTWRRTAEAHVRAYGAAA
jgi:glycosyltransferase involved in cell wall biosynthesis